MCHTLLIRVALAAPRMADDRGRACFCGRYSHQLGKHYVDFPDGTQITYNLAECWGKGIMYGERICDYLGTMEYKDPKNNLLYVRVALGSIDRSIDDDEVVCADTPARAHSAQLKFNPEVSSWFGFSKKKLLSDYLLGGIYEGDCVDEKKKICHIDGTWLGSIEFDGLPYWKFDESPAKFMPIAVDSPLPSDCRYREDIIYLKAQDIPAAGEYVQPSHYLLLPLNSLTRSLTCSVRQCRWKHTLEERQRRDARLRKDWEKQNKKGAKKDKKSDKKSKKDSSQ